MQTALKGVGMKKVLIGVSGGVDSSVSAYLLKEQGYDVYGVHFSLRDGVFDSLDAKSVCKSLDIPLYEVDFSAKFEESVFSEFINDYATGLTPNLCVLCNQKIKFGLLFEFAKTLGIDTVATGHYCSVEKVDGRTFLKCAKDEGKDQTYFLNQVKESVFENVLFPLASYSKEEVRKIAEDNGLVTAHKKGSSDICLMQDKSFREFLKPYIPEKKGEIVSDKGELVGHHDGLYNFTLGQRKGLGLGGKQGESGRWFVIGKDCKNNKLIVSHGSEDALFSDRLVLENCNFIGITPKESFSCLAKTRYRQQAEPCTVYIKENFVEVIFDNPQRAITSGQYCVFYKDGYCIGGGKIK